MNRIFCLLPILLAVQLANGQLLKKIVDKTVQKTKEKVSEKISDKASDAATKPIDDATDGKKKDDSAGSESDESKPSGTSEDSPGAEKGGSGNKPESLTTYSKFDFVPGEKVLVYEDFSQDALGDFPAKWNTNGSGEIVTVEEQTGHWLMVNKKGRFILEFITDLPENHTFEFDLICNEKCSFYSNALQLFFLTGGHRKRCFRV